MAGTGDALGAEDLRELSSNAEAVVANLDRVVAGLQADARLATQTVVRPHPLLVLVRSGQVSVILAPACVLERGRALLEPYIQALAQREAVLVLCGRPRDSRFDLAADSEIAAVLPEEPTEDELVTGVRRALELLHLRRTSTLPPAGAMPYLGVQASPTDSMRTADLKTVLSRVAQLEVLHKVGIALSAEQNRGRLVEMILLEAKRICNADGGTLYIRTDEDELKFAIMRTDSLGIALGGSTGGEISLPPLPLYDPVTGAPNLKNVATAAAMLKQSVNIPDAYHAEGLDFSGMKVFDQRNNYRSKSFLTIPMVNSDNYVIGVLQLLNATDPDTGEVVAFGPDQQSIVEALASQAAIALSNRLLLDGQKELLDSFIRLMASAIDAKSPYTGGHCERVPILTEMIARSLCDAHEGPFRDFQLDDDEWYELHIAAWLHDCGKVTTPVHVMDKATKLETIFDRMEIVRARFETLEREAEINVARALSDPGADADALRRQHEAEVAQLHDDLQFLETANVGGEFMSPDKQARVRQIAARPYRQAGEERPLMSPDEVANLCISRGTLTEEERVIINMHIVHTIRMLEALPFPRNLKRVPEYASGHHEKMDGTGYPRGMYGVDMSVPARIMAVADVFEALTAQDRPYKPGKKLSEAMRIMGFMKKDNHLDPEIFDQFVRSGLYRKYGEKFLPPELLDEVDEQALLAIRPTPIELPDGAVRAERRRTLLAPYRSR